MLRARSSSQVPLALGVPYSAVAATDASAAWPASTLQTASFFEMADRDGRRRDAEQIGGERLDVGRRYPRRTEIGVDVAGQHVFGLHCRQRLGVAGVCRPGRLGGFELFPHVARQIGVGGLPVLRFRVAVDQVAQFGDDGVLGLAVELRDIRQVDAARAVEATPAVLPRRR